MSGKKIFAAILILVVAVGGFIAGLVLMQRPQDVREEAAVPGGQATVSLQPSVGNFAVGDTISTNVMFNTANIAISGIAVRIKYPYSGASPEVTPSIEINSSLLSSGDWTCPTRNFSQQSGEVVIDIACANTSAAGFTASTDTMLAKINLTVNRQPENNPVIMRFDPSLSIITQKSNGEDILLIPTSTGTYTIGTVSQATTAPTQAVSTPTVKPTAAPTKAATAAPTVKATGTVTATVTQTVTPKASASATPAKLPDAGVSYPTLMGLGAGAAIIIGALFLAL